MFIVDTKLPNVLGIVWVFGRISSVEMCHIMFE